jgi:hypothetical protein
MTEKITVTTKEQAWAEANRIFPTDYEKDDAASARAGYDIYRHRELSYYTRICDLGNRLEILLGEHGENVVNIFVIPPPTPKVPQMEVYRKPESGTGVVKGEYEAGKAWRVYLTKSERAAYEMAHGFGRDMEARVNGVTAVKCGKVDEMDGRLLVPPLYRGQGYYYAAKEHDNTDGGAIEIIIC